MVNELEDVLMREYGANVELYSTLTKDAGFSLKTRNSINKGSLYLRIPHSCLLHCRSLYITERYSNTLLNKLNATQILSIHLSKLKLSDGQFSQFEQKYLDSLPKDLNFHPLYWDAVSLESLPNYSQKLINDVKKRYLHDYELFENNFEESGASEYLRREYQSVFLWSWLIVNTRCLWYPVKDVPKESQLALCPYLDLLNHNSPSPNTENLFNSLPKPQIPREGGYELINQSDQIVEKDSEVFFMYGPHSDSSLLAEYGFCLGREKNAFTECNISELVISMITTDWRKEELESNGLWDDYTLHLYPSPAYPSQRTLSALRLICLEENQLEEWRKTVRYEQESVSEENEVRMREELVKLCKIVSKRSSEAIKKSANETIRIMWEAELETANQVKRSTLSNVIF